MKTWLKVVILSLLCIILLSASLPKLVAAVVIIGCLFLMVHSTVLYAMSVEPGKRTANAIVAIALNLIFTPYIGYIIIYVMIKKGF